MSGTVLLHILGVQQDSQFPVSSVVTTSTQTLLSSGLQHHSISSSINSPPHQIVPPKITLDANSKVLTVLKKNYTMLCCTLPQEFKQTIFKMKQLLRGHDDVLNKLTDLPTVDLINEKIIEILMLLIKSDTDAINFCDVMENLVNSESSTATIEALRNEILEAITTPSSLNSSSPLPVMTTVLTTTQTISTASTRSTTVYHTPSVSSVKPISTTSVNSVTQLPQGL